ncbi:CinA family protein [Variovorax sp. YR216]|uniref:CinA family protein n=1 Tax=Variovorax sp. YR216 TaxID=1882828 RepID=UPI000B83F81E|nr:CinA family protein [Variovorax sp. YR216]
MNEALGSDLPSLAVLAERVGASLRRRRESVAVVESSAGGLVSASLLAIPGASAFYFGGAVVYSRRAGRALLGLTAADLRGMRGETEPYALLVAGRDDHCAAGPPH